MLTERQRQILSYLLQKRRQKAADLAGRFAVSEKTVRNEIKAINKTSFGRIVDTGNYGIQIGEENRRIAYTMLGEAGEIPLPARILHHLLLNEEPRQCEEMAEFFYVSPSTLGRILSRLNQSLEEASLRIARVRGEWRLEGSYHYKKKLMLTLYSPGVSQKFGNITDLSLLFPHIDRDRIRRSVFLAIERVGGHVDPYFKEPLLIHIFTLFSICGASGEESLPKGDRALLERIGTELPEYAIARQAAEDLGIAPGRVWFRRLLAKSLLGFVEGTQDARREQALQDRLKGLVEETARFFTLSFDFGEYEEAFWRHVRQLVRRAQNANMLHTAQLAEVIQKIRPYAYGISAHFCTLLDEAFGVRIYGCECALLAWYFGMAAPLPEEKRKIQAAYLSDGFRPIDERVCGYLEKDLGGVLRLRTVTDSRQLAKEDRLVVALHRFAGIARYRACLVSPCLDEADRRRLEGEIIGLEEEERREAYQALARTYFRENLFVRREEEISFWEACRLLGNLLAQEGALDVGAACEAAEENGLRHVNAYGNALLCGARFRGGTVSRAAVLYCPGGIRFGENGRLRFLLAFGLARGEEASHKKLIDTVGNIFTSTEKAARLERAGDYFGFMKEIGAPVWGAGRG